MYNIKFRVLILALYFGVVYETIGQEVQVGHEFIDNVLRDSGTFIDIVTPHQGVRPLKIPDITFGHGGVGPMQRFIRTADGLFVLIDGTGRVYEVYRRASDIKVKRLDSTVFSGNNFGAYSFAYRDTIYSYGGYGFWHYNGQLRVYLPRKHEWELIELDREIPIQVANPLGIQAWFDGRFARLYVVRMPDKALTNDSIYVLDLPKRAWTVLGLSKLSATVYRQVQTPWGILSWASDSNRDNIYLLDFRNNRIWEMNLAKSQEIKSHNEDWQAPSFFSDSILFLFGKRFTRLQIGMADFHLTDQTIYEAVARKSISKSLLTEIVDSWRATFGIVLAFLTALLMIYGLKKGRRVQKRANENNLNTHIQANLFDEKEKDLVRLVFDNSSRGHSTSIEDINLVLGLFDKPADIQKKHRSDVIISINRKFKYITNSDGLFLKKSRSVVDKRTFEYFIEFNDYDSLSGCF